MTPAEREARAAAMRAASRHLLACGATPPDLPRRARRAPADPRLAHATQGRLARAAGASYEAAVECAIGVYRERMRTGHPVAGVFQKAQPVAKCIGKSRGGAPMWTMVGQSGPDYTGCVRGGRAVLVEVKGAARPSLPLERRPGEPLVAPEQAAQLAAAEDAGALAGLVVRVESPKPRGRGAPPPRWYWIPWRAWLPLTATCDGASLSVAALDAAADAGSIARIDCSAGWPDWLAAALHIDTAGGAR